MQKRFRASALALKSFAIIAMTMNHAGLAFEDRLPAWAAAVLIGAGGATYMIMAFFLAQGYRHTRSVRRYALRLFVFALLSQPVYALHPASPGNFNVLFTLLLSLTAIHATASRPASFVGFFAAAACALLSGLCDWAFMGVVIALIFFWIPDRRAAALAAFAVPALSMGLPALLMLAEGRMEYLNTAIYAFFGCLAGSLATLLFSGARGGRNKPSFAGRWAFYLYYPLHLGLIDLAAALLGVPLAFRWPFPFA